MIRNYEIQENNQRRNKIERRLAKEQNELPDKRDAHMRPLTLNRSESWSSMNLLFLQDLSSCSYKKKFCENF